MNLGEREKELWKKWVLKILRKKEANFSEGDELRASLNVVKL